MEKPAFWSDGIRFQCQGSGNCCTSRGGYGYVYLTAEDRRRFARHFKIPMQTFTKRYCKRHMHLWHLKNVKEDCEFLAGKRCTVYAARPMQCRTWPFWPENMNAKVWNVEIAKFCPGIGKGPIRPAREIAGQLKQFKGTGF